MTYSNLIHTSCRSESSNYRFGHFRHRLSLVSLPNSWIRKFMFCHALWPLHGCIAMDKLFSRPLVRKSVTLMIACCLYGSKRKSCWSLWASERFGYLGKIILQRIISVAWLTNVLSEIRNLIKPWWWVEQLFQSVKRFQTFASQKATPSFASAMEAREHQGGLKHFHALKETHQLRFMILWSMILMLMMWLFRQDHTFIYIGWFPVNLDPYQTMMISWATLSECEEVWEPDDRFLPSWQQTEELLSHH